MDGSQQWGLVMVVGTFWFTSYSFFPLPFDRISQVFLGSHCFHSTLIVSAVDFSSVIISFLLETLWGCGVVVCFAFQSIPPFSLSFSAWYYRVRFFIGVLAT
jgi:hypothetical protein